MSPSQPTLSPRFHTVKGLIKAAAASVYQRLSDRAMTSAVVRLYVTSTDYRYAVLDSILSITKEDMP